MKKKHLIILTVLMAFSILIIIFYMPKTIKAIKQKSKLIEGDLISGSGTIKEVRLNQDGYWITTEENSYILLVYNNIAQDDTLLNYMQTGDRLFYEMAKKDFEELEYPERTFVIIRSLRNGENEVFTLSEYIKNIEGRYKPIISIGLFFTIGSGICFILCFTFILIITGVKVKAIVK